MLVKDVKWDAIKRKMYWEAFEEMLERIHSKVLEMQPLNCNGISSEGEHEACEHVSIYIQNQLAVLKVFERKRKNDI